MPFSRWMDIETVVYIYTLGCYSAIKKNKIIANSSKCRQMNEVGEYHARWDKPIPKTRGQMISLISEWWYVIWGREGGKNGGRMDCIEEKEEWEGWGEGKMTKWDKHHYPMYMYDYTNDLSERTLCLWIWGTGLFHLAWYSPIASIYLQMP